MHFYRHVWTAVPTSKVKEGAAMKAIHAQEDRAPARQEAEQVAAKLEEMKLPDAAEHVPTGIEERLYYYMFRANTGDPCGRIIRWSASCVKCNEEPELSAHFTDRKSALMFASARLRHVADTKWGTRRSLDMNRL